MSRREKVQQLVRGALDFLFPRKCAGCGEFLEGGEGACSPLCAPCEERMPAGPLYFCPVCTDVVPDFGFCNLHAATLADDRAGANCALQGMVALGSYDDPLLARLIHSLKYEGARELGVLLGQRIASLVVVAMAGGAARSSVERSGMILVPVPLHRRRLIERDYNQAHEIAKGIAMSGDFEIQEALERTRVMPAQAQLAGEARRKNVLGIFAAACPVDPARRYILVDDVATTGATLQACADALAQVGAKNIFGAVIARG